MSNFRASPATCLWLMLAAVVFWLVTGFTLAEAAAPAGDVGSVPASSLHARHQSLQGALATSAFKRPLVLESKLNDRDVKGDIFAVVPSQFTSVSAALNGPQVWCDILSLHLNTKYCSVLREAHATMLLLNVGKKFDQPLSDSFRLTFKWWVAEQNAGYLRVNMSADSGPLSTHDYQITMEAVPLENGSTFLHLAYSYGFGLSGKLAMQAYLGTLGRNKVGFTQETKSGDAAPVYVAGMRGLVERNTMRYYLAIESFLGAMAVPERARFEKRINDWFTASERFPHQLHEIEREDYLNMKRREYRRQQTPEKLGLADFS